MDLGASVSSDTRTCRRPKHLGCKKLPAFAPAPKCMPLLQFPGHVATNTYCPSPPSISFPSSPSPPPCLPAALPSSGLAGVKQNLPDVQHDGLHKLVAAPGPQGLKCRIIVPTGTKMVMPLLLPLNPPPRPCSSRSSSSSSTSSRGNEQEKQQKYRIKGSSCSSSNSSNRSRSRKSSSGVTTSMKIRIGITLGIDL